MAAVPSSRPGTRLLALPYDVEDELDGTPPKVQSGISWILRSRARHGEGMLQWLAQIEMDSEVIFVGVRDTYVPPPECVVEEDQVEAVRAGSVTNIAVVNHSVTNLQCRHEDLRRAREERIQSR